MRKKFENILLIAGCGQNIGKTTLACQVIQNLKGQKPIGVKITPHFHTPTPGLIELAGEKNWKLYVETNPDTNKDTSRFLLNGAHKSYLIQTQPEALANAVGELEKWLPKNQPVIAESAALIEIIDPGFFIVVLPNDEWDKNIEPLLHQADLIVITDRKHFYPSPEKIIFNNSWLLS